MRGGLKEIRERWQLKEGGGCNSKWVLDTSVEGKGRQGKGG